MDEDNRPVGDTEPEVLDEQPPKRPEYTKSQRLMALILAIVVIAITFMYIHAIATGELFTR